MFALIFIPTIKGPRIAKTVLKRMKVKGVYVYPCISLLVGFCLVYSGRQAHSVALAVLKLTKICLLLLSKCWD